MGVVGVDHVLGGEGGADHGIQDRDRGHAPDVHHHLLLTRSVDMCDKLCVCVCVFVCVRVK